MLIIGVEEEGLAVSSVASSGAGARAEKVGVTWGRGVAVCQCHRYPPSLAIVFKCVRADLGSVPGYWNGSDASIRRDVSGVVLMLAVSELAAGSVASLLTLLITQIQNCPI